MSGIEDDSRILVVEDEELVCSPAKLSALSPYFKTLFYGAGFREGSQDKIVLRGQDPEVIRALVRFSEDGQPPSFTPTNVVPIMLAADMTGFTV